MAPRKHNKPTIHRYPPRFSLGTKLDYTMISSYYVPNYLTLTNMIDLVKVHNFSQD